MSDVEFEAFAREVKQRVGRILGAAGNGSAERAGAFALELSDFVSDTVEARKMQQEQTAGADRYDLGALKVDAATSSNSETGWERED